MYLHCWSLALQMLHFSLALQQIFLRIDKGWFHPSLVSRNGVFLDWGKQDTRCGWFTTDFSSSLIQNMENISFSLHKWFWIFGCVSFCLFSSCLLWVGVLYMCVFFNMFLTILILLFLQVLKSVTHVKFHGLTDRHKYTRN